MKKYLSLYILLFLLLFSPALFAQVESETVSLAGFVMDERGEELIGVTVMIKDQPGVGTTTDLDGRFRLSGLQRGATAVFSFIGYKTLEVLVNRNMERERIVLQEDISEIDEVVVTAQGTQRKISVTGAITTVDPKDLQVPAVSVSNMLGGRVPGIVAITRSGEPGNDFSEFWIRGMSTFGANQGPLILIDGIEGDLNNLDPSDIESFSVLKDAASTAVYGVRGQNGIVTVTTRRGKAGKLKFMYKGNLTYSYSPRMPKYLGAESYAALANEASIVRGGIALYSPTEIELFRSGLDPDFYPNVNWQDEILKDHTWYNQHYMSMSGGGENARYFLSVGYMNKEGIFKTDKSANKYNPNVNWNKYNIRLNIDADLTRTTLLQVGLETVTTNQKRPGYGNNDALWSTQAGLTPVTVPVRYSSGQLAAMGDNANEYNPYALLNHTGLIQDYTNTSIVNLRIQQKLDFITEGLTADVKYSYSNYVQNVRNRIKTPYLGYARWRNRDGSPYIYNVQNSADPSFNQTSYTNRRNYGEFTVNYNRLFGDHRFGGLLLYYMESYNDSGYQDDLEAIPYRNQAISGRLTYAYKDTYFLEFNAGYTGSEVFRSGEQFGFFPALSLAWAPTQYEWVKENIPFVDFFKIRGSVGEVGNDRLNGRRFPYLTTIGSGSSGIWSAPEGAISESMVGSDNLVWEKATKYNLGIDMQFWENRFNFTIDFFKSVNSGIFQERATIPLEVGLTSMPFANLGDMESKGLDGQLSYGQDIGKDMYFQLRGNFTFSKNIVTHWEQAQFQYPYQSWSGVPYEVQRGLVALGLFKDEDDIRNSPEQTFGSYLPGDIKYRDVNGDGKIDSDDEVPLSYSNVPQFQYGLAGEFRWKNLSVGIFFEGTSRSNFFYGGYGYYPFSGGATGNILTNVGDQANRWTPASYSNNPATENANAMFPRLTYGNSENNNRNSTFWLANGKYLRLSSLEIGYTLSNPWIKKYGLDRIQFSVVGNNLACWDDLEYWDAAQASANGAVYPLQRTFTGQIVINF